MKYITFLTLSLLLFAPAANAMDNNNNNNNNNNNEIKSDTKPEKSISQKQLLPEIRVKEMCIEMLQYLAKSEIASGELLKSRLEDNPTSMLNFLNASSKMKSVNELANLAKKTADLAQKIETNKQDSWSLELKNMYKKIEEGLALHTSLINWQSDIAKLLNPEKKITFNS